MLRFVFAFADGRVEWREADGAPNMLIQEASREPLKVDAIGLPYVDLPPRRAFTKRAVAERKALKGWIYVEEGASEGAVAEAVRLCCEKEKQ